MSRLALNNCANNCLLNELILLGEAVMHLDVLGVALKGTNMSAWENSINLDDYSWVLNIVYRYFEIICVKRKIWGSDTEVSAIAEVFNFIFVALEILRLAHVIQLKANHKEISVNYDYTFWLPLVGRNGRDGNQSVEWMRTFKIFCWWLWRLLMWVKGIVYHDCDWNFYDKSPCFSAQCYNDEVGRSSIVSHLTK